MAARPAGLAPVMPSLARPKLQRDPGAPASAGEIAAEGGTKKAAGTLQPPRRMQGLKGEVLGREAIGRLLPAWHDLCRRTLEDNAYYTPQYAQALLDSVERDADVRFAAVWSEAELLAMLPFTRARLAMPLVRPTGRAWETKYTFSCTPLLDKLRAAEAADALLDVLGSVTRGEWIIPTVNTEGQACEAIAAALGRRGLRHVFLDRFQRATLERGRCFDDHMMRHVASKRRKDLARNRRGLEKLGKLEHETYISGEGLERAVATFLKMEANGWKGRRGTALACNAATQDFAIKAFTGTPAESICRADVLTLDGVALAVSLMVLAGRTGFTVKSTYDEGYRSSSVGLLLEIEVIRSFLSEDWADRLDSATAGSHVLDGLWPGRIDVADLVFSLSPRLAALRLPVLERSERTRRKLKAVLKRRLARGP